MTKQIQALIDRKATFIINHSGGKDSQAMTIYLRSIIPPPQLRVIHAHLPEVEWPGAEEHARDTSAPLPFERVQAGKTFFEMVERRGKWPSPSQRQCTSDLKRGPIEKAVRHYCQDTGQRLIVQCMGMRAEESSARRVLNPFKFNERNSKAGREWYDWLPIHHWKIDQVFAAITKAGQSLHWAYAKGMTRLSCSFCIMASKADLQTAKRLRPELYQRYCQTERVIDHSFLMPVKGVVKFLPERLKSEAPSPQLELFS